MSDLKLLLPAIISHHRHFVEIVSDDKFYFQKKWLEIYELPKKYM
jgi:hypothetical protein